MNKNYLSDLPPEIVDRIVSQLEFSDICHLSTTSCSFHAFAAPSLFANLSVSSKDGSDKTMSNHVEKYGKYVTNLYFRGLASPAVDKCHVPQEGLKTDEDGATEVLDNLKDFEQDKIALPASISKMLSGQSLPNLRSIYVHFAYDYHDDTWTNEEGLNGFFCFTDIEDDSEVPNEEAKHKWRALMAETWSAVASNSNGLEEA